MKYTMMGALLIGALLLGLAGLSPGPAESQNDPATIQRVMTLVNTQGILYPDQNKYNTLFDDFQWFNSALWDTTSKVQAAGTAFSVVDSLQNGLLKLAVGATKLDAGNVQSTNAPFRLVYSPSRPDSSGVALEFETRFMISEKTQSFVFAGLGVEDEDWRGGIADAVYFYKPDGTDSLYVYATKSSTATFKYAGVALANRTMVRLRIVWTGVRANFYVNDEYKTYISTSVNLPTANLKPSFEYAAGDSVAHFAYLDYLKVVQKK
jgi:hypothetical protein